MQAAFAFAVTAMPEAPELGLQRFTGFFLGEEAVVGFGHVHANLVIFDEIG